MRRFATICALSLAAFSSACIDESPTGVPATRVTPSYTLASGDVTDLGWLNGGGWSTAHALNGLGHAAGVSRGSLTDYVGQRAVLFRDGSVTDLGTLGGESSSAQGINDSDVVVGFSTIETEQANHAFVWENGVMTDLNFGAGNSSAAWGINNSGVIVGQVDIEQPGAPKAVKWVNGVGTVVGALCADCVSIAKAISDNGHIVGFSGTEDGRGRAFIHYNGVMTELPPLVGYGESQALGVNNLGDVVGFSYGYPALRRATLWRSGVAIDLGEPFAPAGKHSEARGINDAGQIVGAAFADFSAPGAAVIWQNGSWGYLPAQSVSDAYAINDNSMTAGQRVHNGTGQYGAVLWNVTPSSPFVPSEVNVYAQSHNQLEIYWTDNSYDESRFTLQRRVANTGAAWELVARIPANVTGYMDGGRAPNTSYQYRVSACNSLGCSTYATSYAASTLDLPSSAPNAPWYAHAEVVSPTSLRVTWHDQSFNEDKFGVYIRVFSGGTWGAWTLAAEAAQNATSYVQAGLAPATTYQFRVRACNTAGCSALITSEKLATPAATPARPTNLVGTAVSASRVDLTWVDASTNETSFTLQRRAYVGGVWSAFSTIVVPVENITSYSDTGLDGNTRYQYRIRACAAKCSLFTNSAWVTTP